MKTVAKTTSHKIADEPPPCLQCHHGRHSDTTPHYAMTWPQDHDNNHAQMCTIR
jgi:hypothetical protein